jgi:DNA modification methylase
MRFLVDKFSIYGEVVLDPFVGSGTTAVAAKMEGRNYIGIEISEKYCEIAKRRVASAPTPLFSSEKIAA